MYSYQYQLEGLSCPACQKIIQKKVGGIKGVKELSIELNGKLQVTSERELDKSEVLNSLKGTDYKIL